MMQSTKETIKILAKGIDKLDKEDIYNRQPNVFNCLTGTVQNCLVILSCIKEKPRTVEEISDLIEIGKSDVNAMINAMLDGGVNIEKIPYKAALNRGRPVYVISRGK